MKLHKIIAALLIAAIFTGCTAEPTVGGIVGHIEPPGEEVSTAVLPESETANVPETLFDTASSVESPERGETVETVYTIYHDYAATNILEMSESDALAKLGGDYEMMYLDGSYGYHYPNLSVWFSVNNGYITTVAVSSGGYVASGFGSGIDSVRIGMTVSEVFDLIGVQEMSDPSLDMMYSESHFTFNVGGYTFRFSATGNTSDSTVISCWVN